MLILQYLYQSRNWINKQFNAIFVEFNSLLIFYLLFSYPTRKQFDDIGTAIVRKLKLPLTKDNVVSRLLLFNSNE